MFECHVPKCSDIFQRPDNALILSMWLSVCHLFHWNKTWQKSTLHFKSKSIEEIPFKIADNSPVLNPVKTFSTLNIRIDFPSIQWEGLFYHDSPGL